MPEYRVYTFGFDGHILRASVIECDSDDEAIEKTKQLVDGHALELWLGARRLGRFEAEDHSGPTRHTRGNPGRSDGVRDKG